MGDMTPEQLLLRAYAAFNARDSDAAVALIRPDVDWPNAITGGRVVGREEVRAYWAAQFAEIDPRVEPVRIAARRDGRFAVDVHQVVRDRSGALLSDGHVQHVYRVRDGLVEHMEVREP